VGVVRKIHDRDATITVESHAEVLTMPGGQINNWANKFVGQLRARTIKNAPTNKRPRWAHYGKPLKETIISSRPRFWGNGRDKQRVYAAVGSTSPYAYYVDQGTGVFGGKGPYPAKILPPKHRGSPTLYEATWKPGGPWSHKRVAPVMIQGQEGQKFFEESLRETMHHMRLSAFHVPGFPEITDALGSAATGLAGFSGNTPADSGFIASLEQWRGWRDAAWRGESGPWGGKGPSRKFARQRAEMARADKVAKANRSRFLASQAASERRRRAENARFLKEQQAKELGKKREAEREAKFANGKAKLAARARAVAFGKRKDVISGRFYNDEETGLASFFRVVYRTRKGNVKTKDFSV
jgi:hypothetical protein